MDVFLPTLYHQIVEYCFPSFKTSILNNGLRVVYYPLPGAKSVSMELVGKAGSRIEGKNEIGAAHFLEHLLVTKDNKVLVENIGGRCGGWTSPNSVSYWTKILPGDIKAGLVFLAKTLLGTDVTESAIQKEKKVIEQEIRRFKDRPDVYLYRLAKSDLYPKDRLGQFNSGDVEDIWKIDKDVLVDFKSKYYTAANFVLGVAGNVNFERFVGLVRSYLGKIPSGGEVKFKKPLTAKNSVLTVRNQEALSQARLVVNYPGVSRRHRLFDALRVVSSILGVGRTSRLNSRAREEKALVYSIGSSAVSGPDYGFLSIEAGSAEKKINELLVIIFEEVAKIRKAGVSEEEIERVRKNAAASFVFRIEDTLSCASYAANSILFENGLSPGEELKRILSVTREQVREAAELVFSQKPKVAILAPTLSEKQVVFCPHQREGNGPTPSPGQEDSGRY